MTLEAILIEFLKLSIAAAFGFMVAALLVIAKESDKN